MTSSTAAYRYVLVACVIVVAGCARSGESSPVSVVDLLREFERAEQRPPAAFTRTSIVVAGLARPSIVAPAHSRATWDLPLPRHGVLRALLAVDPTAPPGAAVRFRVGVSDHRIYEALAHRIVHPANGWVEFQADLSAYAGFKWSLFYRPDRTIWRLVLATDPAAGGGAPGVWGSPEIVTDHRSAMEYVARRYSLASRRGIVLPCGAACCCQGAFLRQESATEHSGGRFGAACCRQSHTCGVIGGAPFTNGA